MMILVWAFCNNMTYPLQNLLCELQKWREQEKISSTAKLEVCTIKIHMIGTFHVKKGLALSF